jgi:hypothetical protein
VFWRVATPTSAVVAALLAGALAAVGGEPPPARGPEAGKREPIIEVKAPFEKLFTGKKHLDRVAALKELLPRAGELADAARTEAERLRGLPPSKEGSVTRNILEFAVRSLDALAAEPGVMKSWKAGLSPAAAKVAEKVVAMDCSDRPVSEVIRKASAGWGVPIELSPAAWPAAGALDVTLEGSPTLKEFLDWLCQEQGLVCGCSGDKVVLALPASVKLQENMAAAEKK